ncbi:MAG: NAD(P)H-dependent glycerol-3-phosphate dehydrogenase [Gammaproteobacteria bacterium]|nr:NAD(P)H-dependent glycerol-3-phosphate dehydrogenase [Gammaproteobacteria bacterium]
MNNDHRVLVIGGGSFGTVLADIVANNGYASCLWMRDEDRATKIRNSRINERYLPGFRLHADLQISTHLETAIAEADTILFSVPSKVFRDVLDQVKDFVRPEQYLVTTTKGIEPEHFLLMSQVLEVYFPNNPIGVISGPNLAKEIAARHLAGTVVASDHEDLRQRMQDLLQCAFFRVYASNDRYGVELGGALKNIYAIAAGLSAAMDMGENTRSMLMTRSLAEMSRLAVQMGANPMTFLGLSGVGDLIVTCNSPLSRNYRVGFALGQGKCLEAAVAELGEVAEGVNTLALVKQQSDKLGVSMPLVDALYSLVYQGADASGMAASLMGRDQNSDVEFVLQRY